MNDRKKLAELLFEAMISCYYGCGYDDVADHLIANGVVIQKQGEWILVDKKKGNGVCSNCNRLDGIDSLATHCRYCGAIMKKEV